MPVSFGLHLGPDELVFGPLVYGSWQPGPRFYVWAGGGVGLDMPVGTIHLLPELDVSCVVGDVSCTGYLLLSFR